MAVESSLPRDAGRLIGRRIKQAREARQLSQAQLATALGLSQAAMSTIESGARPLRVDELLVVSKLTGYDVNYFLAPTQQQHGPVGVTLRAEVAQLAVPEYHAAVARFLDEIEQQPLPEPEVALEADDPIAGAQHLLTLVGASDPPIDVHAIARRLGVAVFARAFPDALSALVVRHGAGAAVGVNSGHHPVRQRFSIAHELGHFVLHHEAQHFVDYGTGLVEGDPPNYSWQKERAANEFAAELLMPAGSVRADASRFSIGRLARHYKVSEAAMAFRLGNLGLRTNA